MKRKPTANKAKTAVKPVATWRYWLLLAFWGVCGTALVTRAVWLQVINQDFLDHQGDVRNLRTQPLAAHRGLMTDRNGKPLAVSTPVTTLWANPQEVMAHQDDWGKLRGNSVLSLAEFKDDVLPRRHREFIYLKRRLSPSQAKQVLSLNIPGIHSLNEYRRYYPVGAVASQLIGITGYDGHGQEGLELSYDHHLSGQRGKERVIRDLKDNVVQVLDVEKPAIPGKNLTLSIDSRIQYVAFKSLAHAVKKFGAKSGSVVVLDAKTGEVLAMANQPTYNPNTHAHLKAANMRNRAVTDVFEPGSSMKTFTVAAALESGLVTPQSQVNTNPGYLRVDGFTIRDHRNYGVLDITTILTKSSNVGASKLALSLDAHDLPRFFSHLGFGDSVHIKFPGISDGFLPYRTHWTNGERAALSYGYGLSVSTLQLAHAYAVIANDGIQMPLSLLRVKHPQEGRRVISSKVANQLVTMLETVVSRQGTADRAKVPGYRVAGKTGTTHKSSSGGYDLDEYVGVFAGMAPAPNPRYVTVVMINEPKRGYYGGVVAAPVFSKVMQTVMRIRQVAPNEKDQRYASVYQPGGGV